MTKPSHMRGGRRTPAGGRPKGSTNVLEYGEVAAVAAAKLRIPEQADPAVKHIAGRALMRMLEVMEEKVSDRHARNVLAAATRVREEACGPLGQKLEVTGSLQGMTDEQLEARLRAIRAKAADLPELPT